MPGRGRLCEFSSRANRGKNKKVNIAYAAAHFMRQDVVLNSSYKPIVLILKEANQYLSG